LAAGATVVVAALKALQQDDLKRRLAYSTISQMGYLTLALSLLGPLATVGALVHLVHHAFMKGALFFCAGSFAHVTGAAAWRRSRAWRRGAAHGGRLHAR
jgi:multicomponent Na+:H+ antiporter subunit D